MKDDEFPESDRADGAPHPRETRHLFGQDAAEAQVVKALNDKKLHHAWLLSGLRGVGKATLAWRMARFLLATPAGGDDGLFGDAPADLVETLDVDMDHPVTRRIKALSDPGLLLLRPSWDNDRKKLRTQIVVDDVRRLNGFFGLSSADGGRRVVIVDSADDMNVSAANALLKVLEEPPKNAILILVSHHPARLLPTIRSRCREVRLAPLEPEAVAKALHQAGIELPEPGIVAALSGGSAGEALRLVSNNGAELYAKIIGLIGTAPNLDRAAALSLAEKASARGGEERLDLTLRLIDVALARLARTGTGLGIVDEATSDERNVLTRLSPDYAAARKWANLQQTLSARIAHARGVNIDPQSLVLNVFLEINEAA